ncbi:MAG: hypothetical protein KGI06_06335 [Candidatus Micrarchaeota archaeon]|nr:hypothetical protein [Candidatus Micrarchaeota archaeon]
MKAYHFLRADMTAGNGDEPPWAVGETRSIEGELALCGRGYHSSPSWADALQYAPGPVACIVEVSEPKAKDAEFPRKQMSRTRTLLAARDVSRELRLFAWDCEERPLAHEWAAGEATDEELAAAWVTARDAARKAADAAWDGAWVAARDAAWAAARDAARNPAWDAAWAAARDAARNPAWDAAWVAARDAARNPAWATAYSAAGAAQDAERDWQRQRLAALLDPVLAAGTDVQGEDA